MFFQPAQDVLLWMSQVLPVTIPFLALNATHIHHIASYSSHDGFVAHCSSFVNQPSIPGATVHFSQYVPAGTNLSLSENHPSCDVSHWIVSSDICRVAMSVPTSNTSEMSVEAWFPYNYTGRYVTTTNRGLGGCILYSELEHTTSLGFASMGMNAGYNGSTAEPLLNNPDAIADYAYRSAHTGTVAGKELTTQFYGAPFRKSYYFGCSSGGRQGFKEAQDFPEDFDGILAGAPALGLTRIVSWGAHLSQAVGPPGPGFITPDLWALVYDEILRQCDKLDGAEDGLLEDPTMCQFTPEVLICTKGQQSGCLTSKQAESVRAIFSPFYGLDGGLLYPRMQPGVNTKDGVPFYFNGNPSDLAEDWFRHVVYNDTKWSGRSFSLQDAATALAQNPFNVETWEGDLGPFAARGSKLLTYHGLQDSVIPSEISQVYYAHVARTMSLPPQELDNFYRLFLVSGMNHCAGGDGAAAIGQDGRSNVGTGPGENALMALVRWVEEGVAPEVLRGAKLGKDGVTPEYWRAHCRWPRKNRYVGPGAFTEEDAWVCE